MTPAHVPDPEHLLGIPNVLSIAGSDPSGGAGIQADLKTFGALRTYGMAAITGLTAQNTRGVSGVELVSPGFVHDQILAVRSDVRVDAVKIGMLGNAEVIEAVADALRDFSCPIVLDPVMVATSGDALLSPDSVDALATTLLPLATLVTPNLPEADVLTGRQTNIREDMSETAGGLLERGCRAVLLKGGHLQGETSPDLLATPERQIWLASPRIDTRNTHGSGCTLSSAIAAFLARGDDLEAACRAAKTYVHGAIAGADELSVGDGTGPTHHFHDLWRR